MQIRPEQARALSEHAARSFESRMLSHLQANFPTQCAALGESETRRIIAEGVRDGAGNGLVSERDVCVFIDTIFLFGGQSDDDAPAPWAANILNDDSISGSQKSKLLQQEALQHESESRRQPESGGPPPVARVYQNAGAEFSASKGIEDATEACPAETWIGILVRDLEGTPVPRQDVRVVLDSGAVLTGTTNAQGYVRFEGVEPGGGEVTAVSIPEEAESESGADSSEEARASRARRPESEAAVEAQEEGPLLEPLEIPDEVFPDEEA